MSDLSWRIIILGFMAAAVLLAIWQSGRAKRGAPTRVARPDLGPGVHFFSSETCATCIDARKILQSLYGDRFAEIRFEDDPVEFGAFGVRSVPTVFVLDADGSGIRIEGVPSRRQLESGP
jgi:hypothetical protein